MQFYADLLVQAKPGPAPFAVWDWGVMPGWCYVRLARESERDRESARSREREREIEGQRARDVLRIAGGGGAEGVEAVCGGKRRVWGEELRPEWSHHLKYRVETRLKLMTRNQLDGHLTVRA